MTLLETIFLVCGVSVILFPFIVVVIAMALDSYYLSEGGK